MDKLTLTRQFEIQFWIYLCLVKRIKKESVQLEHKIVTELILVIFRDGVEILEREKGSNDLERIERGAVCGENLMYGSVEWQ